MVKIRRLEFFKGEFNGVYQKLWIAISENSNVFKTLDLEYYNDIPDIKTTKWRHISNEQYSKISDELYLFRKIYFEVNKIKKSRGLKM